MAGQPENELGYVFRKADALGEQSNLDVFVDRKAHIIWIRNGMTPREESEALERVGRSLQLQSPTIDDARGAPVPRRGSVS